jgi:hypothetical protein
MNVIEHLLTCAAEESAEVGQAAGKALRFGLRDSPPSGGLPNNLYIVRETNDLLAILEMLQEQGVDLPGIGNRDAINEKKEKVKRFMTYAKDRGTLEKCPKHDTGGGPCYCEIQL